MWPFPFQPLASTLTSPATDSDLPPPSYEPLAMALGPPGQPRIPFPSHDPKLHPICKVPCAISGDIFTGLGIRMWASLVGRGVLVPPYHEACSSHSNRASSCISPRMFPSTPCLNPDQTPLMLHIFVRVGQFPTAGTCISA